MPEILNHNITSCEKMDRISQNFAHDSAQSLLSVMNKYNASFERNYLRSIYNYSLEDLYTNTQLCTTVMKGRLRKKI